MFFLTAGTFSGLPLATRGLEPAAPAAIVSPQRQEATMTHWHDEMVEQPETDGALYATGWTISGLAVLGVICAVWMFGV